MISFSDNSLVTRPTLGTTVSARQLAEILDTYDKRLLEYIIMLHNIGRQDKIDISKIENIIDLIEELNKEGNKEYLDTLLHPEITKGSRIPAQIPVPSTSFQLHNCVTLSTNTLGNLIVLFNPFFLYNKAFIGKQFDPFVNGEESNMSGTVNYCSSFLFNNSLGLNGSSSTSGWKPANIGQGIPRVYNSYRLVSGSIVMRYIGRLDIVQGLMGGSIVYDDALPIVADVNQTNPTADSSMTVYDYPDDLPATTTAYDAYATKINKYGNYDLARDAFFHQEVNMLEGIRELYFPIDNSYEEYVELGEPSLAGVEVKDRGAEGVVNGVYYWDLQSVKAKKGFNYLLYIMNGVPNAASYKIDIYLNFEAIPDNEFLDYMPSACYTSSISPGEKKASVLSAQKKSILPYETYKKQEMMNTPNQKPSLFNKLINKVGSILSSSTVQTLGEIIPTLKPLLAVSATLMSGKGPATVQGPAETIRNFNAPAPVNRGTNNLNMSVDME